MSEDKKQDAMEVVGKAYQLHMKGEVDKAIELYTESLEIDPTPEAFTFRGWAQSYHREFDEAIADCHRAIDLDPEYGNPYNDIGAYLIEQGKHEEAIPWLVQATESERYESYHYPWYNLGRAHVALEAYNRARDCFTKALIIQPDYRLAEDALEKVRMLLQ